MNDTTSVTQTFWQPELIGLTTIRAHGVGEQQCFVDPSKIMTIRRGEVNVHKEGEARETAIATFVELTPGCGLWVTEDPETVNRRRAAALGKAPARLEAVR